MPDQALIDRTRKYIQDMQDRFPGIRSWCDFTRMGERYSLGMLIYDTQVSLDGPAYVLEVGSNELGKIMLMPDSQESMQLMMTGEQYRAYIDSAGKTVPPGFQAVE